MTTPTAAAIAMAPPEVEAEGVGVPPEPFTLFFVAAESA